MDINHRFLENIEASMLASPSTYAPFLNACSRWELRDYVVSKMPASTADVLAAMRKDISSLMEACNDY